MVGIGVAEPETVANEFGLVGVVDMSRLLVAEGMGRLMMSGVGVSPGIEVVWTPLLGVMNSFGAEYRWLLQAVQARTTNQLAKNQLARCCLQNFIGTNNILLR